MKVGFDIKRKGTNRVLSVGPGRGVDEKQFLKCVSHLMSRISNLDEFFFLLDPYREIESFERQKLCQVISRDKRWTLARPTSWEGASEILIRITESRLRGVDAFSPARAGYVPRGGGLSSSGYHWFKPHLRRLKWFCLFWLDKDDQFYMELWAKRGRDNVCERLFQQLTGGEDPRVRAEVDRERRRRERFHNLGLLGLSVCAVALVVILWSPRSVYWRLAAWLLLGIPLIPSLALLILGGKSFEADVELPPGEERSERPRS